MGALFLYFLDELDWKLISKSNLDGMMRLILLFWINTFGIIKFDNAIYFQWMYVLWIHDNILEFLVIKFIDESKVIPEVSDWNKYLGTCIFSAPCCLCGMDFAFKLIKLLIEAI